MLRFTKYTLTLTLVAALILVPFGASVFAQDQTLRTGEITTGKMTADLLLVRPAGIFATLLGGALFIVGSPFSYYGGNLDSTYEKLVKAPARYTFKRPLGDI